MWLNCGCQVVSWLFLLPKYNIFIFIYIIFQCVLQTQSLELLVFVGRENISSFLWVDSCDWCVAIMRSLASSCRPNIILFNNIFWQGKWYFLSWHLCDKCVSNLRSHACSCCPWMQQLRWWKCPLGLVCEDIMLYSYILCRKACCQELGLTNHYFGPHQSIFWVKKYSPTFFNHRDIAQQSLFLRYEMEKGLGAL